MVIDSIAFTLVEVQDEALLPGLVYLTTTDDCLSQLSLYPPLPLLSTSRVELDFGETKGGKAAGPSTFGLTLPLVNRSHLQLKMLSGYKYKSLAKVHSRCFRKYISAKKCILISFWIFQYCFYYSFTLYYCAILKSLNSGLFSIPSGCQTAWIQIRLDILSGLIWVQTVCKGYQQMIKDPASRRELKTEQLLDTTFWLKPWLKSISLAPTFSILLKCWLQQILSQGRP